jgi:hypothetical protein
MVATYSRAVALQDRPRCPAPWKLRAAARQSLPRRVSLLGCTAQGQRRVYAAGGEPPHSIQARVIVRRLLCRQRGRATGFRAFTARLAEFSRLVWYRVKPSEKLLKRIAARENPWAAQRLAMKRRFLLFGSALLRSPFTIFFESCRLEDSNQRAVDF